MGAADFASQNVNALLDVGVRDLELGFKFSREARFGLINKVRLDL
jgi:hypothetical protein